MSNESEAEDSLVHNDEAGEQVDLSSGSGRRKAKNKRLDEESQRRSDLLYICSTLEGRRVLWHWLAESSLFVEPYCGPGREQDTAFRLGQQHWGRRRYVDFQHDADLRKTFMTMQNEAEKYGW